MSEDGRVDSQSGAESPATTQPGGDAMAPPPATAPTTESSGRRQAFRDIRRQLAEEDLASPGVQRLLLDHLDQSEAERDNLRGYVERFHSADKRAAVLDERLNATRSIDVMFAVGVGGGCAIIGLAPLFWPDPPRGPIALIVGFVFVIGATVGRLVKR